MSEKELTDFCEALQEAQIDDLALIARQVLVQRRGRYSAEDHPFISTSLRRLAGGQIAEDILQKLSGKSFIAVRLYTPNQGVIVPKK